MRRELAEAAKLNSGGLDKGGMWWLAEQMAGEGDAEGKHRARRDEPDPLCWRVVYGRSPLLRDQTIFTRSRLIAFPRRTDR